MPGEPSEAMRLIRPSHSMRIKMAQECKPDAHRPPTSDRLGRLLVEMHGLGIVGAPEGDDLVLGQQLAPEGDRLAERDVLVMHRAGAIGAGRSVLHAFDFPCCGSAVRHTGRIAPCQRRARRMAA